MYKSTRVLKHDNFRRVNASRKEWGPRGADNIVASPEVYTVQADSELTIATATGAALLSADEILLDGDFPLSDLDTLEIKSSTEIRKLLPLFRGQNFMTENADFHFWLTNTL